MDVGFGIWRICSVSSTYAGNGQNYTPEACRSWYAGILSAQKVGSKVMFFFSSSASGANGPACSLGNWVLPNPSPYFMELKD
ncbi:MAG TPA: hypothetical protein VFP37_09285 [Steroidobacteraceae bacterium]|nr:hypothetical protein [Steroidobacteraceae bacterium]